MFHPHLPAYSAGVGGSLPSADLLVNWEGDSGITVTGSGVSSWVDTVSGIDVTQATDANRPLHNASDPAANNHGSLEFDGTAQALRALVGPSTVSTSQTWYAVIESDTTSASQMIHESQTGRVGVMTVWVGTGSNKTTVSGSFSGFAADTAVTGFQILIITLSGATATLYRDGALVGTATSPNVGLSGNFGIGATFLADAFFFDGKIFQVGCYEAVVDVVQLHRYLDRKYRTA